MKKLLESFVHHHTMIESAKTFEFHKDWKNKIYLLGLFVFVFLIPVVSLLIGAPLAFLFNAIGESEVASAWLEANPIWSQYLSLSLNLIIAYSGVYLLMYLFVRYIEKRPFKTLGFIDRNKAFKLIRGFLLGVASAGFVFLVALIFTPSTLSTENTLLTGLAAVPIVLLFLIPWTIQALAEEVIFQGWLVPHLTKRNGVLVAIIFSAIVFAIVHILSPNVTVLYFINLVLYGALAALWMLYEKSIYGIAAYHIAWNWSLGELFGVGMGEGDPIISFFYLNREGNALLTGGPFGDQGTITNTILLTVLIAGILYLQYRRLRSERNAEETR